MRCVCEASPSRRLPKNHALMPLEPRGAAGGLYGLGFFQGFGFCQFACDFQKDLAWPVTGCQGFSLRHGFICTHGFSLCHQLCTGFFQGERFFQGSQTCGSFSSRCTRLRMWRVPMSCAAHSGIAMATSGRLFWRGGSASKSCLSACSTAGATAAGGCWPPSALPAIGRVWVQSSSGCPLCLCDYRIRPRVQSGYRGTQVVGVGVSKE